MSRQNRDTHWKSGCNADGSFYGANGRDGVNGHCRCHDMATYGTKKWRFRAAAVLKLTRKNGVKRKRMAKRKGARWGHPLLLPMRGYRGCGHTVATAARMVRILHFGKLFITFVAQFGISFRGDEEFFGLLGEGLHQRVVADLAHDEVAELAPVGLLRVEVEAVLAGLFLGGVEVPEVPVAALDGLLLLVLRATHTDLDAVVDAGCVADDERRAVVGLGLLDDVEVLGLAGAHSHLGDIDVAVALGNHTEVFLADLLAAGGELGDGTGRGGLRALSAGVGVHLGVDDDDVDILAAGQDVVEAAEADVIAPAVAAEDPLALLDEAVTEFEELLADVALAGFHQRDELVGNFLGAEGVLAVLDPLGEEGLDNKNRRIIQ